MEESKRVRLIFKDDDILSEAQMAEGLNRSWVLLKLHQHNTISDVVSHLLQTFQLYQSCPHGLLLSMCGFVLPPFESTCLLKDNEIISVIKRRNVLSIDGSNDAVAVNKLKTLEKQQLHTGVLLLENEEFRKGKIECDCDDTEEESDKEGEDLLEDGYAEPIIQKRKAMENFQASKKRQRIEAPGIIANSLLMENMENSHQDGIIRGQKIVDFCSEDDVEDNEEIPPPSDKSNAAPPDTKLKTDVEENDKVIEDTKIPSKEAKKVPSRSARRKYAKRRWMREMANIQKNNASSESEGLRNWIEDRAKAERKKFSQPKGPKKWKITNADAEKDVTDGQPKGLLHWKQLPLMIYNKGKKWNQRKQAGQNQNGFEHELITQSNDNEYEQPSQTKDDVHEQHTKNSDYRLEQSSQTDNASKPSLQESDKEHEVVPIVIRPGHIRFEPFAEEDVQLNHVTLETIQWNGITSKKKGQKWGLANSSFTPKNDFNTPKKERSKILSNEKERPPVDFFKLPNLSSMPKEDDIIVYRILELSSTWTPELSPFRVGKVLRYTAESNLIMLVHVPEYPIVSRNEDEDNDLLPDISLYKEDGSLEVDFSSLVDVRIMKHGISSAKELACNVCESSVDQENDVILAPSKHEHAVAPSADAGLPTQGQETPLPVAGNDGLSIWDQISEALDAKKEQLSQENSWGKSHPPLVPRNSHVKKSLGTNRLKNAKSTQVENNRCNQNMGNKSWSYKALRGSGLGATMNILRSTKEI